MAILKKFWKYIILVADIHANDRNINYNWLGAPETAHPLHIGLLDPNWTGNGCVWLLLKQSIANFFRRFGLNLGCIHKVASEL